jgi:hypothetical protein
MQMATQSPDTHLTTQCPQCATTLQADIALLQRSNGWARCGRCHFLFDVVNHAGIPTLTPTAGPKADHADPPAKAPNESINLSDLSDVSVSDDVVVEQLFEKVVTGFDPALNTPHGERIEAIDRVPLVEPPPTADPSASALWRAFLNILIGLLLFAIVGQLLYLQRDRLQERWPNATVQLLRLCQPVGCEVPLKRDLNVVKIISSSVVHLSGGVLQLNVVIENESTEPIEIPEVWLSLANADGIVFAAQGFGPDDWRTPSRRLDGEMRYALVFEWPLDVTESEQMRRYATELRYSAKKP